MPQNPNQFGQLQRQFDQMAKPLNDAMERRAAEAHQRMEAAEREFAAAAFWGEIQRIGMWALGFSLAFWMNFGIYLLVSRRVEVQAWAAKRQGKKRRRRQEDDLDDYGEPVTPPPIDDRLPPPKLNLPDAADYRRSRRR